MYYVIIPTSQVPTTLQYHRPNIINLAIRKAKQNETYKKQEDTKIRTTKTAPVMLYSHGKHPFAQLLPILARLYLYSGCTLFSFTSLTRVISVQLQNSSGPAFDTSKRLGRELLLQWSVVQHHSSIDRPIVQTFRDESRLPCLA